ncbi:hypothetical protein [Xanthomonas graminis]|uniref:hypothetical protein n=1 Tax=Xanthomonas graminis TaxID=3390026 RepID=UPI000AA63404|nr:hypothetical protein [Xanthomonas translucens]
MSRSACWPRPCAACSTKAWSRALLPLVAPGLAQDQRGAVAESPGGDVAEIHRPLAH